MKLTFKQHDEKHPEIWEMFEALTLEAIGKGFKNYSARTICHLIRWHQKGDVKGDGFKINNNYTPMYGEKFMNNHPEYKGFFRKRRTNT